MEKYAYVTVITNSNYILGLKALAISLHFSKPKFPLVVLIPKNIAVEIKTAILKDSILNVLEAKGVLIIKSKEPIDASTYNVNNKENKYWENTFFKLSVFSLLEYSKIILLDSDMMILQNIDRLFLKEAFSASNSGEAKNKGFKYLNSGLMVLKPNIQVYTNLLSLIPEVIKKTASLGKPIGDQDIIRHYLVEWEDMPNLHLDESYNLYLNHIKYYIKKNKSRDIKVVHFVGPAKPFQLKGLKFVHYCLKCTSFYSLKMVLKYKKIYNMHNLPENS